MPHGEASVAILRCLDGGVDIRKSVDKPEECIEKKVRNQWRLWSTHLECTNQAGSLDNRRALCAHVDPSLAALIGDARAAQTPLMNGRSVGAMPATKDTRPA